jgi:hypothetical protein
LCLAALACCVGPSSAAAGTYPWVLCSSEGAVGSAAALDHVILSEAANTSVTPCSHNNNHTDSLARKNDFNTFTVVQAPSGTSISAVTIDAVGNNYAFNRGWGYLAYSPTKSVFCSFYENQFPNTTCGEGVGGFTTNGPQTIPLPDATPYVYLGIYCRNLNGCEVGTLDFRMPYLDVQVQDDVRPVIELSGPAWEAATISGTAKLSYRATDNASGTQGVRIYLDGAEVASTIARDSTGCDVTSWKYCPDDAGAVDVPVTSMADGSHLMVARAEDAAGNVSVDSSRTFVVDNKPPTVGAVSLTGVAREAEVMQCTADVQGQSPTVSHRWLRARSDGSGQTVVAGATGTTYTLTAEDVGKKLVCEVTGKDGGGTTVQRSSLTEGPFADGALVAVKPATAGQPGTDGRDGTNGAGGTSTSMSTSNGLAAVDAALSSAATAAAAAVAPCTAGVVKSLGVAQKMTRSYGRSAVRFSGRLLNPAGEARPGRLLEVVQTSVRSSVAQRKKVAEVRTATDGAFRVTVPKGPSRALQLIDPACGSLGALVTQRVRGAMQAKTSTKRIKNRQTAKITGRVMGGYVGRGIPLELQVKVGRQWRDVKHVMSNSRGEFKVGYRFLRTLVRYTYSFRVVTRAGGAWPYMQATSKVVKVRVN